MHGHYSCKVYVNSTSFEFSIRRDRLIKYGKSKFFILYPVIISGSKAKTSSFQAKSISASQCNKSALDCWLSKNTAALGKFITTVSGIGLHEPKENTIFFISPFEIKKKSFRNRIIWKQILKLKLWKFHFYLWLRNIPVCFQFSQQCFVHRWKYF